MAEDDVLAEIRLTNRLLAALIVRDSTVQDGALRLNSLGMGNADIAAVFGISEASVRSARSKASKRASGKAG